jgi:hypothetical protein
MLTPAIVKWLGVATVLRERRPRLSEPITARCHTEAVGDAAGTPMAHDHFGRLTVKRRITLAKAMYRAAPSMLEDMVQWFRVTSLFRRGRAWASKFMKKRHAPLQARRVLHRSYDLSGLAGRRRQDVIRKGRTSRRALQLRTGLNISRLNEPLGSARLKLQHHSRPAGAQSRSAVRDVILRLSGRVRMSNCCSQPPAQMSSINELGPQSARRTCVRAHT